MIMWNDGFFDTFSEGALNEGITTMDGEVYVLPEAANIVNTLVFYNKNVLEDAGVYKCTEEGREAFMRFIQTL